MSLKRVKGWSIALKPILTSDVLGGWGGEGVCAWGADASRLRMFSAVFSSVYFSKFLHNVT